MSGNSYRHRHRNAERVTRATALLEICEDLMNYEILTYSGDTEGIKKRLKHFMHLLSESIYVLKEKDSESPEAERRNWNGTSIQL